MAQESIAKVPNQTAAKRPNCFSSFFRPTSSVLHQLLVLVYARTAAFSTEQCTTPSLFHNFEASQGAHKYYGFQFGMPFSLFVLTHAHLKIT